MYFKAGDHKQAGLRYNPFKALIAPRPIGWISTCDKAGLANLAPYSFFNAISELPPMVMFVSAPDLRDNHPDLTDDTASQTRQHRPKDSLHNIRETGEFGVNIVSEAQRSAMVVSSSLCPRAHDEFALAGLEKMPAKDITAPLVKGAPAHLECRLHEMIALPGTTERAGCVMVIGHVISLHIDETYILDGKVDVAQYQPIARLGYKDYATISELYEITEGLR